MSPLRSACCRSAVLLFVASACAARAPSTSLPAGDRNVLTHAQLTEDRFTSVLEAIEALRPAWLQPRGTDSFKTPSQVLVYLDENRLGGIETLSSVAPTIVVYIRHYDGIAATARWGLDHGQGVIYVSTHP